MAWVKVQRARERLRGDRVRLSIGIVHLKVTMQFPLIFGARVDPPKSIMPFLRT